MKRNKSIKLRNLFYLMFNNPELKSWLQFNRFLFSLHFIFRVRTFAFVGSFGSRHLVKIFIGDVWLMTINFQLCSWSVYCILSSSFLNSLNLSDPLTVDLKQDLRRLAAYLLSWTAMELDYVCCEKNLALWPSLLWPLKRSHPLQDEC